MATDTKEYNVNSYGHWQGIERTIKEAMSGINVSIEDIDFSDVITELTKIENGQSSTSQQLTEIETLLTTSNNKVDSLIGKLDTVITNLQAIVTNTSGLSAGMEFIQTRLSAVEARTNFPLQEETQTTLALTPNVYHQWGEVASLDLTFASSENEDVVNEYVFQFTSGATPTVLTLPSTVKWIGDSTIEASKTYTVTVVNNLAVLGGA